MDFSPKSGPRAAILAAEAISPADVQALRRQRADRLVRAWSARVAYVVGALALIFSISPHLLARFTLMGDMAELLGWSTAVTSLLIRGALFLLVARGLLNGHRIAWLVAVGCLLVEVIWQMAADANPAAAIVLGIGAAWLFTRLRAFPVTPSAGQVRQAAIWLSCLAGASMLAIIARWLGAIRPERAFATASHLVSLVGVGAAALFGWLAVWWLLSPRPATRPTPAEHVADRERARAVLRRFGGGSLDHFALNDQKDWFFTGHTVVPYTVRSGVCLVSPDPIGPAAERVASLAAFGNWVVRQGWSLAVMGATEQWLDIYRAAGLRVVYMGDEAIAHAPAFSLDGHRNRSLRHSVNRVARTHHLTLLDPAKLDETDPKLRAQIEDMFGESRRGQDERGFSMGLGRLFDPNDTGLLMSVTRNEAGRVDAICQWVPAPGMNGWSLDIMRRRVAGDGLPNGLVEFTIAETLLQMGRHGEDGLCLNFAAFREIFEGERPVPFAPVTRPILNLVNNSAQLESLADFNRKFRPCWVHRYLAMEPLEKFPWQLMAVVGAEDVDEIPVIGRIANWVGSPDRSPLAGTPA